MKSSSEQDFGKGKKFLNFLNVSKPLHEWELQLASGNENFWFFHFLTPIEEAKLTKILFLLNKINFGNKIFSK
jgi:hypothetical protein